MKLRGATAADASALADVHASAFDAPWSAADLAQFIEGRGAFALALEADGGAVAGFILCRVIAGEAEMLTLAVHLAHRRNGVATALIEEALGVAASLAEAMFLEVAADNPGAMALYERAGFTPVGRRAAYYARPAGGSADAIVMRRALNS